MKFLEVTSGKCEVFTAPDVNVVDKLYNGREADRGDMLPGAGRGWAAPADTAGCASSWRGVQRYAAVLADRCHLVTLSLAMPSRTCVAQGGAGGGGGAESAGRTIAHKRARTLSHTKRTQSRSSRQGLPATCIESAKTALGV